MQQDSYYHDSDKKVIQLQPDLTQNSHRKHIVANYEYPPVHWNNGSLPNGGNLITNQTGPRQQLTRSNSEHHYDVPHFQTT